MPRPAWLIRSWSIPCAALTLLAAAPMSAEAQRGNPFGTFRVAMGGNCTRWSVDALSLAADRRSINVEYYVSGGAKNAFSFTFSVYQPSGEVRGTAHVGDRGPGNGVVTVNFPTALQQNLSGVNAFLSGACSITQQNTNRFGL